MIIIVHAANKVEMIEKKWLDKISTYDGKYIYIYIKQLYRNIDIIIIIRERSYTSKQNALKIYT